MSFGRNPHVAKAEAEELKARTAGDRTAEELAWREAARQWDRAAAKEAVAAQRDAHAARATAARENADAVRSGDVVGETPGSAPIPRSLLN